METDLHEEFDSKIFDMLDSRMKKLENAVFGSQDVSANCWPKDDIISALSTLGSKLGNALSTRDRMMMVMKRLGELERYLDPTYGETCELNDSAKADLVLSQEDNLQNMYQQLNNLNSIKQCLASQEFADALNSQNNDLVQLWRKNNDMDALVKEQSETITDMLENYNSIIMTLTETFIKMDEIVTKAEVAAIPLKSVD